MSKAASSKAPTTSAKAAVKSGATGAAAPTSATGAGTAPSSKAAKPTVVDTPQAVILGPVMRKKELIDAVVERSAIKKKDAKPVVDAMLAILGEALADNRELILPPLGRIKVRREKALPNGRVMVVKVRQSSQTSDEASGDDGEDI